VRLSDQSKNGKGLATEPQIPHCEERSDKAIPIRPRSPVEIAALRSQ
jgi:hypothetical protein